MRHAIARTRATAPAQRNERGAQLNDAEIAHWRERRRFFRFVVWILFRERPRERIELGVRRSRADAWAQPRGRLERVRAAPAVFLVERDRRPHGGLAAHESERGRHHPDDLERTAVNPRDGADDVRTTAIAALPQTEADDRHVVAGPIFFSLERPAHERGDAEHPERRRRHAQARHALGLPSPEKLKFSVSQIAVSSKDLMPRRQST